MGIKWLDKSHRSPVSCKEISREQVANRLQSRCKQGLSQSVILSRYTLFFCGYAVPWLSARSANNDLETKLFNSSPTVFCVARI